MCRVSKSSGVAHVINVPVGEHDGVQGQTVFRKELLEDIFGTHARINYRDTAIINDSVRVRLERASNCNLAFHASEPTNHCPGNTS